MIRGDIYILTNPSLRDDYLKIGLTLVDAKKRAIELSKSSSIPLDFQLKFVFPVMDVITAERRIHLLLDRYRINPSKEFFCLPIKDAVDICKYVSEYENEDGSIFTNIEIHDDLAAAHYAPHVTASLRQLIYILIGTTTNNTFIDRLLSNRRGKVDGFLKCEQLAQFLSLSPRSASDSMKKLAQLGSSISCRPIEIEPINRVFEFVQYHKRHLAWRFSDDYRKYFRTTKI